MCCLSSHSKELTVCEKNKKSSFRLSLGRERERRERERGGGEKEKESVSLCVCECLSVCVCVKHLLSCRKTSKRSGGTVTFHHGHPHTYLLTLAPLNLTDSLRWNASHMDEVGVTHLLRTHRTFQIHLSQSARWEKERERESVREFRMKESLSSSNDSFI
jgi:hypothetical protein